MTDIADTSAAAAGSVDPEGTAAENMADDLAFSVASRCFWHIGEAEWAEFTDPDAWRQFTVALTRMGADLQAPYMQALATPPSWKQFRIAQRRFVGGLPSSAVPVESLYATPDQMIVRDPLGQRAYWLQQPAIYMRQLVERLGMEVPPEFCDCPDHLALELDMASVLLASGARDQAADFIPTRLGWLRRYRTKIAKLAGTARPTDWPAAPRRDGGGTADDGADVPDAPPDLAFHAALVDALADVAAAWGGSRNRTAHP